MRLVKIISKEKIKIGCIILFMICLGLTFRFARAQDKLTSYAEWDGPDWELGGIGFEGNWGYLDLLSIVRGEDDHIRVTVEYDAVWTKGEDYHIKITVEAYALLNSPWQCGGIRVAWGWDILDIEDNPGGPFDSVQSHWAYDNDISFLTASVGSSGYVNIVLSGTEWGEGIDATNDGSFVVNLRGKGTPHYSMPFWVKCTGIKFEVGGFSGIGQNVLSYVGTIAGVTSLIGGTTIGKVVNKKRRPKVMDSANTEFIKNPFESEGLSEENENPFIQKTQKNIDSSRKQKTDSESIKQKTETEKNGSDIPEDYTLEDWDRDDNIRREENLRKEADRLSRAKKWELWNKKQEDLARENVNGLIDQIKEKSEKSFNYVLDKLGINKNELSKKVQDKLIEKMQEKTGASGLEEQMMKEIRAVNIDNPEIFNQKSFGDLTDAASGGKLKKKGLLEIFKDLLE